MEYNWCSCDSDNWGIYGPSRGYGNVLEFLFPLKSLDWVEFSVSPENIKQ